MASQGIARFADPSTPDRARVMMGEVSEVSIAGPKAASKATITPRNTP